MSDVIRMPIAGLQSCKDGCGCPRNDQLHLIMTDDENDTVFEHSFPPEDARRFAAAMLRAADELEARALRKAERLA